MSQTIFLDTFVGTAGASVTSRAPDTTAYLAQTWGGPVPAQGGDAMSIAAGGTGATPSGAGGPPWSEYYPLTGASTDYTATFTWTNSNAGATPTVFLRVDAGGQNFIALDFHYGNQAIYLSKLVAGAYTGGYASAGFAWVTGTTYTAVVTLAGTSITLTINGTTISAINTVPAATAAGVAIRQQSGAVANTVFTSARVAIPSATTATITGPSAITTGTPSANYTITLNAPAPDGGLVLTPTATGFASAFTPTPTVSIAAGATTATFTATSSTAGSGTISATSNGGVTVTGQAVTSSAPSSTITGVSVSGNGLQVIGGSSTTLTATVTGTGGFSTAVNWSATGGATVNSSGFVTFPASTSADQTVVITATSVQDGTKSGSATITVYALPSTATLGSSGSGTVGTPSNQIAYTLNKPAPLAGLVVSLSDQGAGGTFQNSAGTATITSQTLAAGQTSEAFRYTASSAGVKNLTPTAPGVTFSSVTYAFTAIASSATSYTLTAPSPASGTVGNASANFTLQANGTPTTALVVTPSDGLGGTFTPATITIADAVAHTFTYTPAAIGVKSIAVTHTGGSGIYFDPAAVGYTSNAVIVAPSSGQLEVDYQTPSLATIYFVLTRPGGKAWNGTAFETLAASHWPSYAIAGLDAAGVGTYLADFPSTIPVGTYTARAQVRAGASPASTDPRLARETAYWNTQSFDPTSGPLLVLGADGLPHPPASWLDRPVFATDTKIDGTMRAASSGSSLSLDAADPIANALAVGAVGQYLLIVSGTGTGQSIPVASIAGASGARVATVAAGYTLLTPLGTDSGYTWTGLPTSIATLNLSQVLPIRSQVGVVAPTVGDALVAAHAAAVAAESKVGTVLTLKAADGSTLSVSDLDNAATPSTRTPRTS